MRIILLFLATLLFANQKLIITKFENLQPYYYDHQIIDLKLKIITATNSDNLQIETDQNITTNISPIGNDYLATLKFQLKDKFPTIFVSLMNNGVELQKEQINIDSKIKHLYPPKDFCGVLADDMKIKDKILATYDDKSNIVYWTVLAKNGNLQDFKLNYQNERLYFLDSNNSYSQYSYSAIIPNTISDFEFKYFNLKSETYKTIKFHINKKDETISTQTDIKPMSKNNIFIINMLLGVSTLLWLLLFIYKRKIIYIILILLSIASIVFFNLPKPEITLKEGTKIHILPFKNSTVFLVLAMDTKVKVIEEKNGYKKIEFNKYIGWVK